jgi:hypothetical protein
MFRFLRLPDYFVDIAKKIIYACAFYKVLSVYNALLRPDPTFVQYQSFEYQIFLNSLPST